MLALSIIAGVAAYLGLALFIALFIARCMAVGRGGRL